MEMPDQQEIQRFRKKVLSWFEHSGRHDLPWQINPSAYRVWVSEIMLQQTQVSTVIPYFLRFLQSFPTVSALAKADLNEVLEHWSGLGYYARARNLHKTAQLVQHHYRGQFPLDVELLSELPGIGRSTAGAILSLSSKLPAPILDGNVKRVLARFQAVEGWVGAREVLKDLWELSSAYTPQKHAGNYNQAMMDLGATVCTRTKPNCTACPLNSECKAHATARETAYPQGKKSLAKPKRTIIWLLLRYRNQLLLEQRPPIGIWGGLWSVPECSSSEDPVSWCQQKFDCTILHSEFQSKIKHVFSHFELEIQPVLLDIKPNSRKASDSKAEIWLKPQMKAPGGFAAPLKKLLTELGY